MLVCMLESLDDSQGLICIPSDLLVVDSDRSDSSLGIDDKESSQGGAIKAIVLILNQDSIILGNILGDVWNQRNINWAKASVFLFSFSPCKMGEMWIDWNGQNFSVMF